MRYDLTFSGADAVADRLTGRPGVRRLPNSNLQQFIIPHFLSPEQCASLIERIDHAVRPSTVTDDNGDPEFRTSSTGDLDAADPLVAQVDCAICDLLGLPPAFGEPLQGQRYEAGQEFKAHTDYFEPTGIDYEEHTRLAGQRTWTAMAYLNAVEAGGATRFTHTGKIHQPATGKLLAWCNLDPNGFIIPWTLHHAMKVRKGRKYVITKWFREREWGW